MLEDWDFLIAIFPEAFLKLGVALFCGFLLGMEREVKEKPAGLRTIILITVGSALFMIVSDLVALVTEGPEAITRVDPSRIAAQVVTGIGFIGAGVIIQARGSIHGLTTATTIWVASGIGLCVGAGFPILGVTITLLALLVLVALYPVSTWLSRRGKEHALELHLPNDTLVVKRVMNIFDNYDIPEENITLRQRADERLALRVSYRSGGSKQHQLLEELAAVKHVQGRPVKEKAS